MKQSYRKKILIIFIILSSQFIFKKTNCMEFISKIVSLVSNEREIDNLNQKTATSFTDFLQTREGSLILRYIFNPENIEQLFSIKSELIKLQDRNYIININKIRWIDKASNEYTKPEQVLRFIYQKELRRTNSISTNPKQKANAFLTRTVLQQIYATTKELLDKEIINPEFLIRTINFLKKHTVFFVEINYLSQALNLVKQANKGKIDNFKKKFSKYDLNKLDEYTTKYTIIPSFKALIIHKINLSELLHLEIRRSIKAILKRNGFIFIEELPPRSSGPKTTPLEKFTWEKFILNDYLKIYILKHIEDFLDLLAYLFNNKQLAESLIYEPTNDFLRGYWN